MTEHENGKRYFLHIEINPQLRDELKKLAVLCGTNSSRIIIQVIQDAVSAGVDGWKRREIERIEKIGREETT